jgi:hypothetical protein
MTASEWLRVAYFPCLFVALGMLAHVGVRYSQGKELPRRQQRRVLSVGAIVLAVGVVLYATSWFVWFAARPVADPPSGKSRRSPKGLSAARHSARFEHTRYFEQDRLVIRRGRMPGPRRATPSDTAQAGGSVRG